MKVILVIILLIIVLVFVSRTDFFRGFDAAFLFPTSTPPVSFDYGVDSGTTSTGPTGSVISSATPSDIPKGFTAKQLSPYFRKIRIVSVSTPREGTLGGYEEVTLTAELGEKETVTVSGWLLLSNRGSESVPKAVRIMDPSAVLSEANIVLRNRETAKIYSTVNPINLNFRLNKCVGYLEDRYHFTPSLPQECPTIDRADIVTFTGVCQDYINSLQVCEASPINPPVPADDAQCRSFLRSLDYQGCVDREHKDADFLLSEWWTWTGKEFLDDFHDRVLLFDQRGLLVDEYIY